MHRSSQIRVSPANRVMRKGKTERDHASGAWTNHRKNKQWRRFEGKLPPAGHGEWPR